MRVFAAILAIVVLVLSILPCSDIDACMQVARHEATFKTSENKQETKKDVDTCSPFCSCSCCAGFSLTNHQVVLPFSFIVYYKSVYTAYLPVYPTEVYFPVWQPPKLA